MPASFHILPVDLSSIILSFNVIQTLLFGSVVKETINKHTRTSNMKRKRMVVLCRRRLLAGLSPRRPMFAPGSDHVGFVVDEVALGQVFGQSSSVFPVSLIPPWLHTQLYHVEDGQ
jgi:hypothetical protein